MNNIKWQAAREAQCLSKLNNKSYVRSPSGISAIFGVRCQERSHATANRRLTNDYNCTFSWSRHRTTVGWLAD